MARGVGGGGGWKEQCGAWSFNKGCWVGIMAEDEKRTITKTEINLTDEILVNLPIKELNTVLRGFSVDEISRIKKRRKH